MDDSSRKRAIEKQLHRLSQQAIDAVINEAASIEDVQECMEAFVSAGYQEKMKQYLGGSTNL